MLFKNSEGFNLFYLMKANGNRIKGIISGSNYENEIQRGRSANVCCKEAIKMTIWENSIKAPRDNKRVW